MIKKIILSLTAIIVYVGIVFALSVNDLEKQLNNIYNTGVQSGTNIYNQYKNKFEQLQTQLQTGDYRILSYFTGIDIGSVLQKTKNKYISYLKNITTKKYNILADLSTIQTNFENGIIDTGDYETTLQNIYVGISGYKLSVRNEITNLYLNLSGLYTDFSYSLKNKLNYYSGDIIKYKNYKIKLQKIVTEFSGLETKYEKLENIIGVAKNIILKKKDQLKEFVNQYYSDILDKKFKNYLDKDLNFSYFKTRFQTKKKVLLGFVNNQLENSLKKIVDSYYPDVDIDSLKNKINDIKTKTPEEVIKDYNNILSGLNNIEFIINKYKEEIDKKLSNFYSVNKENILEIIKKDVISLLDKTTKLIQDDINQTLESWKAYIENRKSVESPLIKSLTDDYTKVIQENLIESYNAFLSTLESYENTIILPENKNILKNYKNIVENNIKELKIKNFKDQLDKIIDDLDKLSIGDFTGLNQIKKQVTQLIDTSRRLDIPENIVKTLKKLHLEVQLKENLNKLYKCGAISFYYAYGDLTDTVADILRKYYEKYKEEKEEDLFMKKISNAFNKIEVLEQSLNNDMRSYYIIIIHNGLLKFKFELNK